MLVSGPPTIASSEIMWRSIKGRASSKLFQKLLTLKIKELRPPF